MALLTSLAFVLSLKTRPETAKALRLMEDGFERKRTVGRPRVMTLDIMARLVELIDREKRAIDRRVIEMDRRYGDRCTDADALRSFMRRQYRDRLMEEGLDRAEAERRVSEYANTTEFERKLRSHKVSLSRFRRRS